MNAVEFDRVSKTYRIYDSPADRLKESVLLGVRSCHREFRALNEVSFAVSPGEVFCVIGENGSGKSTALQLMAGILQPTSGEVGVNGRVAALLELGAGFNPEFTGSENVYLNASILGMSKKEIDRRFQSIEDFAEIGRYIDQPLKTYSSGMAVRLAFAVAISVDPEILIVDEALAVGDAYFRHKCMRKIQELRARGLTIVFVSHSMADVRAIGDRVLWLRHGEVAAIGTVEFVVDRYLSAMDQPMKTAEAAPLALPNVDHRHGSGKGEIYGIAALNEFGEPLHLMIPGRRVTLRIGFQAKMLLVRPDAGFLIRNHLGLEFAQVSVADEGHPIGRLNAGERMTVEFQLVIPELYPGSFSFSPWIKEDGEVCDWIDNAVTVQMARGERPVYGYIQWPCHIEMNASVHTGQGAPVG
ncbi:MAG TPA: ABC transporter ATP-binding protein [Bryobacteraceae bacterium]|nr:ABC transporter ATP-binding protein [Bryobacteraceae bacterium]